MSFRDLRNEADVYHAPPTVWGYFSVAECISLYPVRLPPPCKAPVPCTPGTAPLEAYCLGLNGSCKAPSLFLCETHAREELYYPIL